MIKAIVRQIEADVVLWGVAVFFAVYAALSGQPAYYWGIVVMGVLVGLRTAQRRRQRRSRPAHR